MTARTYHASRETAFVVDAVELDAAVRDGAIAANLGSAINLSIAGLESYFYTGWRPELVDLLVIAAAVEYCDLSVKRPAWGWARSFDLIDRGVFNSEDLPICEQIQRGLASGANDRLIVGRLEQNLKRFHASLDRALN